jgi:hypothetical protein
MTKPARRSSRMNTDVFELCPPDLQRVPSLAWDVFLRLLVPLIAIVWALFLVLSGGCGHRPTVDDGFKAANTALGVLRIGAEEAGPIIEAAGEIAIEVCAAKLGADSTEGERTACLEQAGFSSAQLGKANAELAKLAAAYDSIAEGLEQARAAWAELQPTLERAREVKR